MRTARGCTTLTPARRLICRLSGSAGARYLPPRVSLQLVRLTECTADSDDGRTARRVVCELCQARPGPSGGHLASATPTTLTVTLLHAHVGAPTHEISLQKNVSIYITHCSVPGLSKRLKCWKFAAYIAVLNGLCRENLAYARSFARKLI